MVRVRRATEHDIPDLERWDRDPAVIAASGEDDATDWREEVGRDVDWMETLVAEVDGRPIGVVQIIDPAREESHYWGPDVEPDLRAIDIWIGEPEMRNRGHGARMMALALERCFAPPEVTAVLIDPLMRNVDAQRFYRRLGFVDVGPRRFGEDDCLVMRLDRARWESRRIGSSP